MTDPVLDPADPLADRFAFAHDLIREAGALALEHFLRLETLTITGKGPRDMVSEADVAVERLIRSRLEARFPGDGFLGEETGRGEVAAGGGRWVVDPIDGTQPFVNGLGSWCVSIAYVLDGRAQIGLVFAPVRDELFSGRTGRGAWLDGVPIHVSRATTLDGQLVVVGYSARVTPDDILPMFERVLRSGALYYRDGSGALMLSYLAAGRLTGYVEPHINAWDCLAGVALIEAAGGRVNDVLAGDGLFSGSPIVAGPPALYPALRTILGLPVA
jgi:myo-inositol-1(or 4)-monophosphatase